MKILLTCLTFGLFQNAKALDLGVYHSEHSGRVAVQCQVEFRPSADGHSIELEFEMDKSKYQQKGEEGMPEELFRQVISIPMELVDIIFDEQPKDGENTFKYNGTYGDLELHINLQSDGVRQVFLESRVPEGKVILRFWMSHGRVSIMDRTFAKHYFILGWSEPFRNRCEKPTFIPRN